MEVVSLPNHVNSCVLFVCLLFNSRLFTVIDLSPRVLSAQHMLMVMGNYCVFSENHKCVLPPLT